MQSTNGSSALTAIEQTAFDNFNRLGIPTGKSEEWKYTRIGTVFNKEYQFLSGKTVESFNAANLNEVRLPGHEEANELVFVNGLYSSSLSTVRSSALFITSLEKAAANEYSGIVSKHFEHSNTYIKDGIHALNTAFAGNGVFVHVKKGQIVEHPVYIYNITDTRGGNSFTQLRTLIHVAEQAHIQLVETYVTIGTADSFLNQVTEVIVEKDALVEYYKIQNNAPAANQVSTTHFRQTGKSFIHAVTISLNGGIIRNNLNMAMEAEYSEAHLYGLYFLKGNSHIDNHTIVDNVKPHCLSNELYKGIIDDNATAVFNGKIFVQPQAQKINAFQSNKNVLLSDTATVNTKPQLEIYADDVKCSHGCTVGQLDEEALFYLRSRGINEKTAKSLLVHSFAVDILEYIKPQAIRNYVDQLISERLEFDLA